MSRRLRVVKLLAEFFAEEGKIPVNVKEYNHMPNKPMKPATIRRRAGNWRQILLWSEKYFPELMEQARGGVSLVEAAKAKAEADAVLLEIEAAKAAQEQLIADKAKINLSKIEAAKAAQAAASEQADSDG